MNDHNIVEFENVFFSFSPEKIILDQQSFSIRKNTFSVILGQSGAGKSSILNLIAGIEKFGNYAHNKLNQGKIMLRQVCVDCSDSKDCVCCEHRKVAFVFQTPSLFAHKNVWQNLYFAMPKKNKIFNKITKEEKQQIIDLLTKIKMEKYIDFFPHQLSVGQQQRIAFARAIISQADIILLDEPFSGLDFESKFLLFDLLLEIKLNSAKTIILVTHDFEEAVFFGQEFFVLDKGKIFHYTNVNQLYSQPQTPYIASFFQFSNVLITSTNYNNNELEKFIVIRPEDIMPSSHSNHPAALIKEIKFFGSFYILVLKIKNIDIFNSYIKKEHQIEFSLDKEIFLFMKIDGKSTDISNLSTDQIILIQINNNKIINCLKN